MCPTAGTPSQRKGKVLRVLLTGQPLTTGDEVLTAIRWWAREKREKREKRYMPTISLTHTIFFWLVIKAQKSMGMPLRIGK